MRQENHKRIEAEVRKVEERNWSGIKMGKDKEIKNKWRQGCGGAALRSRWKLPANKFGAGQGVAALELD